MGSPTTPRRVQALTPPTSESQRSLARLTQRYVVALVVIAVASVVAFVAVVRAEGQEDRDRRLMADANRVRIGVAQVGVLGSELAQAPDARARGRLRQQLRRETVRVASTWDKLLHDPTLSPEVRSVIQEPPLALDELVQAVVAGAHALADVPEPGIGPDTPELAVLRHHVTRDATGALLASLVRRLEQEHGARHERLIDLEQGLLAVVLIALLLSGSLVFRPMARRIEQEVGDLARLNAELEGLVVERTRASEERARGLAESQEALRAQTEVLQSVLDHMEDGVVVVDQTGDVVLHNPAAMRIGGTNLEGSARDLWTGGVGLFHGDGASPARWEELPLNRAIHGEAHSEGEFLLRDIGVRGTWIHALARPRTDSDGGASGAVMVFRDMTGRHEAEQALRDLADELARSNQDLEQFASIASHDLQEPLRVVKSYVQLLERRYSDQLDADGVEFIGFVVEATTRMSHLIRDLLAYSRAGPRGKLHGPVALDPLVDGALANLKAALAESGAEIVRAPLPTVSGDRGQLTQLFQNLVGNALKFRGEAAPRVVVDAEPCELGWRVRIADNGIGIAPEYQERIFAIFQRLHPRGAYAGTGIGLSICKRIVETHGGRMGVESADGEGATFWFELPGAPGETG